MITTALTRRASDESTVVVDLPRREVQSIAVYRDGALIFVDVPRLIGCRWGPGHAVHRDPVSGFYEEVNPPIEREELKVQSALLDSPKVSWVGYWVLAGLALYLAGMAYLQWRGR